MKKIATIGYEGASLSDFIATLLHAGVQRIVDVREVAQSRRPGFSKTALRSALAEVGIDYHHVRQLGDPKHGREAARAGNMDLFRAIFTAHLELPASRSALDEAVILASEKSSALLCYERNPKDCHRAIVAQHMTAISPFQITNLGVQPRSLMGVRGNARTTAGYAGAC